MAKGTLGILITRYEHLDHIAGIVRAARAAGHPVMLFLNDEGVRFTTDPRFLELAALEGVRNAVCDYNCEQLGLGERTPGINYGSQYDHAQMLHESERVVVF